MLKRSPARGLGALWLVASVVAQLIVAASTLAQDPLERAVAAQEPVLLRGVAVVQEPFQGPTGAVGSRPAWAPGSRLQLTFEVDREAWAAALWFSGDSVQSLYPDPTRQQEGWVRAAQPYAVPSVDAWLRLEAGQDLLVLVAGPRPDPEIQGVLGDPSPPRVAALREALAAEAKSQSRLSRVERFLPTPDGRVAPVRFHSASGVRRAVLAWALDVEGSGDAWTAGR